MKCDELQYERIGDANKTYPASTLVVRKQFVDAAIDELKEELYNQKWRGDEWARNANDKDKQIAELKAENAELKAKLYEAEEARIEAGADAADYYQENRRLKRALWLARANDASSFAGLFSTLSYIEDDGSRTYWIFGNKRKIVFDGLKCSRMETAYKWFCIWDDVANKCLNKAKEYK